MPHDRNGKRNQDGGFSIVEVLATLAVAGAVLVALSSIVSLATRQADRVVADSQAREIAWRSLATLAHAIESIARLQWAGPDRRFIFAGTRDSLAFSFDRREGNAFRTRIVRVENGTAKDGTVLSWSEGAYTPDLQDMTQVQFGLPHQLPIGGLTLRFAYVTAGTVRWPEVLTDDWTAEDALPEAVRLALTDPVSGEIRSSLRVPLRAAAEPGCLSPRKAPCSRFDERKVAVDATGPGAGSPRIPPDPVQR